MEKGLLPEKSKKTISKEQVVVRARAYIEDLKKHLSAKEISLLESICEQDKKKTIEEEVDLNIDCQIDFATLTHRDLEKDTKSYQIHAQNKWASNRTIRNKLGYDNDEETEQIEKEERTDYERDYRKEFGKNPPGNDPTENKRYGPQGQGTEN